MLVLAETADPIVFIVWFGLARSCWLTTLAFNLSATAQVVTWTLASNRHGDFMVPFLNKILSKLRSGTADGEAIGEIGFTL